MSGLNPYPEYKKTIVPWIGEIPADWAVKRFKWLLANNDGGVWGSDPIGEGDTIVLRSTDQTVDGHWRVAEPAYRQLSAKERADALLVEGDLVVTKSSGSSLHIGKTTLVTADIARQGCCYGNFMQRLRVGSDFIPKLAWYLMNNELSRAQLDLLSNSTTGLANLNGTLIGEVFLPVASVIEQTQIARFLDHETARIDALIEEQQRLIELLKEKRQAVISHAVTKGLDPTVPMKDSGVEWLGEVPAHWDVIRVKNVARLESGHTPSKEFPEYWENGDIPWVSLNDSKRLKVSDYIEETQFMITALGVKNSSARILPARSVVFTRDATIGLAAITTKEMCVSQHLIAWVCNEGLVIPEFLLLVFYAMEEELDRFTFGATIKTIGMPDIRTLVAPVPPLAEQARVVAEVNTKRELIDQLIRESSAALALYSERRSALISAAVTGKIDVRGWQPPAGTPSPESAIAEAH